MYKTASALYSPEFLIPARATYTTPHKGMELVDLRSLGIYPGIAGGAKGINAKGDLVTVTEDGVDFNTLWNTYQDFLAEFNRRRDPLLNFLSWRTTKAREDIVGAGAQADFEEASEYGEPVGIRPEAPPTTSMGYTFKWYDLAARFTWQYLIDVPSQQIDAITNMAAEAHNRGVFTQVMKTLFNTVRRTNKEGMTVYPFYSGQVGDLPPAVGTTTFADSHQHFVTAAALTPAAVEALITLIREHGYTQSKGYRLVIMINEAQEGTIRQFRSTANGGTGTYDFVPSQGTSTLIMPTDVQVVGGRPPATLNGMEVVGGYYEATIVKNEFIPAGYLVAFATGGEENILNPIAIREHTQQSLRGMRLVKGRTPDYPLIDSYYAHGMGTGIRHRGAGAVLQITGGAYAVPAAYVW